MTTGNAEIEAIQKAVADTFGWAGVGKIRWVRPDGTIDFEMQAAQHPLATVPLVGFGDEVRVGDVVYHSADGLDQGRPQGPVKIVNFNPDPLKADISFMDRHGKRPFALYQLKTDANLPASWKRIFRKVSDQERQEFERIAQYSDLYIHVRFDVRVERVPVRSVYIPASYYAEHDHDVIKAVLNADTVYGQLKKKWIVGYDKNHLYRYEDEKWHPCPIPRAIWRSGQFNETNVI